MSRKNQAPMLRPDKTKEKYNILLITITMACIISCSGANGGEASNYLSENNKVIALPAVEIPDTTGATPVETAIFNRKAVRKFTDAPLSLKQVATLLWAGGGKTIDGVTGATRAHAAAGGLYPLEFYLIAENVEGLEKGLYHYQWADHSLVLIKQGSHINQIKAVTLDPALKNSLTPACIVVSAIYSRTTDKYGMRGSIRYVPMAAGAAGQNIHLQAEALGLGLYTIGAFDDKKLLSILGTQNQQEVPVSILPVGKKHQ